MQHGFRKYQKGNSGPFTEEYHNLLGTSPWIFVKRLLPPLSASRSSQPPSALAPSPPSPHLSEGDVATVFSQFGEVKDVRFVRHRQTGRFLGTAFIEFRDFRSAIIAADEMNSNFETGELCIPYPSDSISTTAESAPPSSSGGNMNKGAGIIVERCHENEIPAPHSLTMKGRMTSYPQWVDQCVPSTTPFWTPAF